MPVLSPTLLPATHTNVWLLGRHELCVVDPGSPWPGQHDHLVDQLRAQPVRAVLLTHHHIDHSSGARALCDATGAPLWAHAQTAERIDVPVDRRLSDGETLDLAGDRWSVVHTPGHAPGHICLERRADGEVIAGDMIAGLGTILLDPPDGDLAAYLASLRGLIARKPRRLLPAHGPPIEDAVGALTELLAHRALRTAQIQAALAARATTPLSMAATVYPELPVAFHGIAARQILRHLYWLAQHGLAAPLDSSPDGVHDLWVQLPNAETPP